MNHAMIFDKICVLQLHTEIDLVFHSMSPVNIKPFYILELVIITEGSLSHIHALSGVHTVKRHKMPPQEGVLDQIRLQNKNFTHTL